jgi:hypothetical protein
MRVMTSCGMNPGSPDIPSAQQKGVSLGLYLYFGVMCRVFAIMSLSREKFQKKTLHAWQRTLMIPPEFVMPSPLSLKRLASASIN